MEIYLFTRKVGLNTEEFNFLNKKRYSVEKHGEIVTTHCSEDKLSRKEQNWYLRNFMNSWCFFH